jgi:hypothetical protein
LVYALAVHNSSLFVGGTFTTVGNITVNRIARWDGLNWSSVGSGMNVNIYSLCSAGNELYATGNFTTAGGTNANRIANEWL